MVRHVRFFSYVFLRFDEDGVAWPRGYRSVSSVSSGTNPGHFKAKALEQKTFSWTCTSEAFTDGCHGDRIQKEFSERTLRFWKFRLLRSTASATMFHSQSVRHLPHGQNLEGEGCHDKCLTSQLRLS